MSKRGPAYYNEFDPKAADVIKQLIREGVLPHGVVDTRSIASVQPDEIEEFAQCHFFAGGGLWALAAKRAGWPERRPLWTGSCPCQPFSSAGSKRGIDDPRHLWPHFHRLIRALRPPVVVGEQVARKAGYGWFDGVQSDLARSNYACRAVDVPACAVNAPHERRRLYWAALADPDGRRGREEHTATARGGGNSTKGGEDAKSSRRHIQSAAEHHNDYWHDAEWTEFDDGHRRRTKPNLPLLVNGFPGGMDLWRVAGNAVVLPLAQEVVASLMDVLPPWRGR